MDNSEITAVFKRISLLMEIKGEDWFKVSAYQRAAESIQGMNDEIGAFSEKELIALPGIGKAIAGKIQEMNGTGKLDFLKKLEAEVPPSLINLLAIPDIGPKKAARFWHELGVTTVDKLEIAAREGKIHQLSGMGQKSEASILNSIILMKSRK